MRESPGSGRDGPLCAFEAGLLGQVRTTLKMGVISRNLDARRATSTLAIVGDTRHYIDESGRLCTYAALAAQLDLWAARFDRVVFCGVLGEGPPPVSFAPYTSANIEMVPLRPAGGPGWRAKVAVLGALVSWIRVLVPVLRTADAVHLRVPCNVTLVSVPLVRALTRRRYAIYAGSWDRYPGEPISYRLQRWMLSRMFHGVVHAYVTTESASGSIRPAFSPVLTDDGLRQVSALRSVPRQDDRPGIDRSLRLVSIGRFSENKNQIAIIRAIRALVDDGLEIEARFIGEGSTRDVVERSSAGLQSIEFVDVASRAEVFEAMAWADLNVLASFREGYPKVLLEGMSAGALPVAADRPMNRSMTKDRGWLFDPDRSDDLAAVILSAVRSDRADWTKRRDSCATYAQSKTLDAFGLEIAFIVGEIWGFPPPVSSG